MMKKVNFFYVLIIISLFDCWALSAQAVKHTRKGSHVSGRYAHAKKTKVGLPDSVYIQRLDSLPFEFKMIYNPVVRKSIELYSIRDKRNMERTIGRGDFYFPIIEGIFKSYGIPCELKYLAVVESSLNPRAICAGATGMWQFTKGTGQKFGLVVNNLVDERRTIIESTIAAAKYLKKLNELYGDWHLVLAAYNCGPAIVNSAIKKAGGSKDFMKLYPYLPTNTKAFIPTFIGIAYTINYYSQCGMKPVTCNLPTGIDTVRLTKALYLQQVANILNIDINVLRDINTHYLKDHIPASKDRGYNLYIPSGQKENFLLLIDSIYSCKVNVNKKISSGTEASLGAVPDEEGKIVYKVHSGDNLYTIAKRHKVTVNKIRAWNSLPGTRLKPGQKLILYIKKA